MLNIIESLNVAEMLGEERSRRKMTFEDVGIRLGCSASYVFRIEKGKRKKPSYEIVSKMIQLFKLSPEDVQKYSMNDTLITNQDNNISLEADLLQHIKGLDVNNMSDINRLLEKIRIYQIDLKKIV